MAAAEVAPGAGSALDQLAIKVVRGLSMDAPHAARSGHQGTAMALAPLAHVLWTRIMRYDAAAPDWPNRDLLMQRAEEQLFTAGGSAADIKAFFKGAAPRTAIGEAAAPGAPGEYYWGGAAGTYFWVDPRNDLVVVFMIQSPRQRAAYRTILRNMIYAAISR